MLYSEWTEEAVPVRLLSRLRLQRGRLPDLSLISEADITDLNLRPRLS